MHRMLPCTVRSIDGVISGTTVVGPSGSDVLQVAVLMYGQNLKRAQQCGELPEWLFQKPCAQLI